jgi:hypothetical protein
MFSAEYYWDWAGLFAAIMFIVFMYDLIKWRE